MNIFQSSTPVTSTDTSTNSKQATNLLTLPKNAVASRNNNDVCDGHGLDFDDDDTSTPSFLLLQLPTNYSLDDFTSSRHQRQLQKTSNDTVKQSNDAVVLVSTSTNAYFVASNPNDELCCVFESKGSSFTVHRVETSNQYIVVPPIVSVSNTDGSSGGAIDDTQIDTSTRDHTGTLRRNHLVEDTASSSSQSSLIHIPAHLISKKGGSRENSGSYFLELRPKQLQLSELRDALRDTLYNPYNNNSNDGVDARGILTKGHSRTIFDLATSLQVSQKEIRNGLQHLPNAFAIGENEICLLADHVINDYTFAITTALATMDSDIDDNDCNCDDYGGVGIIGFTPTSFIATIARDTLTIDERQRVAPHAEAILHHCLKLLLLNSSTSCDLSNINLLSNSPFVLDVSKVALCIAVRLFATEHRGQLSWDELSLFTKWQSELPGVGNLYSVSREMLLGVAICTPAATNNSHSINNDFDIDMIDIDEYRTSEIRNDRIWHYLPKESISTNPLECFNMLYSYKDRWFLYELEPYIHHLINSSYSNSPSIQSSQMLSSQLLLRYTTVTTNDYGNGRIGTYYTKKK